MISDVKRDGAAIAREAIHSPCATSQSVQRVESASCSSLKIVRMPPVSLSVDESMFGIRVGRLFVQSDPKDRTTVSSVALKFLEI